MPFRYTRLGTEWPFLWLLHSRKLYCKHLLVRLHTSVPAICIADVSEKLPHDHGEYVTNIRRYYAINSPKQEAVTAFVIDLYSEGSSQVYGICWPRYPSILRLQSNGRLVLLIT
jgi:hypothetical protein